MDRRASLITAFAVAVMKEGVGLLHFALFLCRFFRR